MKLVLIASAVIFGFVVKVNADHGVGASNKAAATNCGQLTWSKGSMTKKKLDQCWKGYGNSSINESQFLLTKLPSLASFNSDNQAGSIWTKFPVATTAPFTNSTTWNIKVAFSVQVTDHQQLNGDVVAVWFAQNKSIASPPGNFGVVNKDFTGLGVLVSVKGQFSLRVTTLMGQKISISINTSASNPNCRLDDVVGHKVDELEDDDTAGGAHFEPEGQHFIDEALFYLSIRKIGNRIVTTLANATDHPICQFTKQIPNTLSNPSAKLPWLYFGASAVATRQGSYEVKQIWSSINEVLPPSTTVMPLKNITTIDPALKVTEPGSNRGVVIGVVILCVIILSLISGIGIYCCIRRFKMRERKDRLRRIDSSRVMFLPPPNPSPYSDLSVTKKQPENEAFLQPPNATSHPNSYAFDSRGSPRPSRGDDYRRNPPKLLSNDEETSPYRTFNIEDMPLKGTGDNLSTTYLPPTMIRLVEPATPLPQDGPLLNDIAEALPYDQTSFEIQPWRLKILGDIGQGVFGIVSVGELALDGESVTLTQPIRTIKVAIKKPRNSDDVDQRRVLECEMKLLAHIGIHPNVVRLLGAITTKTDEYSVVLEYCDGGNLKKFLYESKSRYRQIDNILKTKPEQLLTRRLVVSLAQQIAQGMEFIHSKRCVHRDLAARNILLCKDGEVAKITDFGLAKDIYESGMYQSVAKNKVPWPWYAPEFLKSYVYLLPSDVWSFGILLWEMFTLGDRPYASCEFDTAFLKRLETGWRLEKPICADDDLYKLMLDCWQFNPEDRPSFSKIDQTLTQWLESRLQSS